MPTKPPRNPTGFMSSLFGLAGIAASTAPACTPETFTFPALLGAEHVATTAAIVRNYTGFPGFRPEMPVLVPAGGVHPFCNVTVSYTHPGHGDLVNLHVWLPLERAAWGGRFMGIGGGGFAVGDVDGDSVALAVQRGYVAATTDGGHPGQGPAESWALRAPGNVDWPLLVNYGHRALHELAVLGKSVAREYYGEEARWSYWQGCSTGGRQALAVAQRYPADFDGVLAMCPAVEFPATAAATYFPQVVMKERGWWPAACELQAVVGAAVKECDGTDGKIDGVIGRLEECKFDVERIVGRKFECDGEQRAVSAKTAEVVKLVMQGLRDEEGKEMFPGFVPGAPLSGTLALMNSVCADEKNRANCTGVPFAVGPDWIRLWVRKDPAFDPASLTVAQFRAAYRQAGEEYDSVIGSRPDLRGFRARGGRLVMWQSMADEVIPMGAARRHYEQAKQLDEGRGFETEEYWRYFELPGVNHCFPPPGAAWPFDMTERLRRWVEEGVAPGELDGRKVEETEDGKKVLGKEVRKFCLWPGEGVWDGKGWRCVKPSERVEEL